MRKLRQWILLPLALLLTAAGALLPYTVSRFQDTLVENRTESRSFDPVSLTLKTGGDVLAGLRNLAGRFDNMSWYGETNLTLEDAAEAARSVYQMLAEGGYIEDFWEDSALYNLDDNILPNLILSTEEAGSPSAVIWFCSLPGGAVVIDDESGKMVALEAQSSYVPVDYEHMEDSIATMASTGTAIMDVGQLTNLADKWTAALSEYYDLEISLEAPVIQNEFCVSFPLCFLPQDEQNSCKVMLTFYEDGFIIFNL
ncbi:MAG: hypothetical protein K2O18_17300 [Oscillospiraceae bacterium]|nr:hypothetical protein [Oscillospiraceae bacterium]